VGHSKLVISNDLTSFTIESTDFQCGDSFGLFRAVNFEEPYILWVTCPDMFSMPGFIWDVQN
jgi:hypothetical protein